MIYIISLYSDVLPAINHYENYHHTQVFYLIIVLYCSALSYFSIKRSKISYFRTYTWCHFIVTASVLRLVLFLKRIFNVTDKVVIRNIMTLIYIPKHKHMKTLNFMHLLKYYGKSWKIWVIFHLYCCLLEYFDDVEFLQ